MCKSPQGYTSADIASGLFLPESRASAASPGVPGFAWIRHQALDKVHNRVGVALFAQEVVRVVDDARRLVRLHVVAVDDPFERAAARN